MKTIKITYLLSAIIVLLSTPFATAQTIFETDVNKFGVSGYLRTGFGFSTGGDTQAQFQMPGALNKYSLGNQPETYGELQFDYTHYFGRDKSKSIDAVWMVSIYEAFGSKSKMQFNKTEQLYLKANNLLGFNESIWFGNRFYDRKAIHMLDRQWLNPGQKGWGGGVENLLNRGNGEDLKFAAWQFKNKDVLSYINGAKGDLTSYAADVRWVNRPISESANINFALNYNYRLANKALGYDGYDGYGAFAWVDYSKNNITNTTALLLRQGANITENHWSGVSQRENPNNDNLVLYDLKGAYSVELNNNFLYDDKENFAVNATMIMVAKNFGTDPYRYEAGERVYELDKGDMFYWASVGARTMYYLSDNFRPSLEYSFEYGHNSQLGVQGTLNKVTFTPEMSLKKGFYSRPVLRPFVTYAFWSDDFMGYIGNTPTGAPFADKTSGFTYGAQFEIWW